MPFWWTGSLSYLKSNEANRVIRFKGPNSRKVNVEFTDSWLDSISFEGRIPLYVGKTADCLKKRISLHLQLNLRRGLSLGVSALDEERKTSSNQVRDRIERMLLDEDDIRSLMINNISLSYVLLDGDSNSVNRFYLEDRAIENMFPLFNIDIER